MRKKFVTVFHIFFVTSLVATLFSPQTSTAQVNNKIVIHIPDEEIYPLFKQSSYFDNNDASSVTAIFNTDINTLQHFLTKTFDLWKLPYQTPSTTPNTTKTDWFLWHYDKESKKSKSEPENSFFSLNVRDKYRFEISLTTAKNQQTTFTFTHIWREQEKDITADSEMVWLKWKPIKPNMHAVNDFVKKIQTEFEKYNINVPSKITPTNVTAAVSATAIVSSSHSAIKGDTPEVTKSSSPINNVLELDVPVHTAWINLIQKLDEKDIDLSSVDTKKHRIQTQSLGLTYTPNSEAITLNPKEKNKHQFKILVLPGPTNKKATIVIYHVNQSLQTHSQETAAAFLKYLELK